MSIKGLHPEQRRDAWIRHRAEWWARRRLGLSSENVWEMRAYVDHSCFFDHSQLIASVSHQMLAIYFQRTDKGLPTTFTPTRRHERSCRVILNFWANLPFWPANRPRWYWSHPLSLSPCEYKCWNRGSAIDIHPGCNTTPHKLTLANADRRLCCVHQIPLYFCTMW